MVARSYLIVFLVAFIGGGTAAQIEDQLVINVGVMSRALEESLCDSQQARRFYEALDDGQDLLDSIPDIRGTDSLQLWLNSHHRWQEDFDQSASEGLLCMPSALYISALDWLIHHQLIEQFIGDAGDIEAKRLLPLMHEMAQLDLPLLNAGPVEPYALVLNQPFIQIPNCTVAQAQTYYYTGIAYSEQVERLVLVNDVTSLGRWIALYQAWIAAHWAPFYQQPCGWILNSLYLAERHAYRDAFRRGIQGVESSDRNLGLVFFSLYWSMDRPILQMAAEHTSTETADAVAGQPRFPEAAADLYATFRAPDVAIIQALVDAYLNRTDENP